ncbi:Nuclear Rna Export Factor 5 [Manis pentadactyla]|nr:Nuclear Rna Export Factor 5 [Manis pentadactyla]
MLFGFSKAPEMWHGYLNKLKEMQQTKLYTAVNVEEFNEDETVFAHPGLLKSSLCMYAKDSRNIKELKDPCVCVVGKTGGPGSGTGLSWAQSVANPALASFSSPQF